MKDVCFSMFFGKKKTNDMKQFLLEYTHIYISNTFAYKSCMTVKHKHTYQYVYIYI